METTTTVSAEERLLVRPEQAAEMLSLHRSRIFPLLKSGRIQSLRIGKSRRIPVDALRRFVAEELAAQRDERLGA